MNIRGIKSSSGHIDTRWALLSPQPALTELTIYYRGDRRFCLNTHILYHN